MVKSQLFLSRT